MEQNNNNKRQDSDIKQIRVEMNSKVSWTIFIAFVLVILGLFGYLATADASLGETIDKNEARFYEYQQQNGQFQIEVKSDLSAIKQALGVKK